MTKFFENQKGGKFNPIMEELNAMLERKKNNYGDNIITYRLLKGDIIIAPDEAAQPLLMNAVQDIEFLMGEENEKSVTAEARAGVAQIKNREMLHARITETAQPIELTYLEIISIIFLLSVIGFASAQYAIAANYLNSSNQDMLVVDDCYRIQSALHYALYNTRECVITNLNLTNGPRIMNKTSADYISYLQNDLDFSINDMYDKENSLPVTDFTQDPTSKLSNYFEQEVINFTHYISLNNTMLRLYTFPEIVMAFISGLFQVQIAGDSNLTDDNYYVRLVIENGYNSVTNSTMDISLLVENKYSNQETSQDTTILILVIIGICMATLFIPFGLTLLYYVYGSIQQVMTLFLDVPYKNLRNFNKKTETFLEVVMLGQYTDVETSQLDESDDSSPLDRLSRRSRRYKNIPSFLRKAVILLLLTSIVIDLYFGINYYLDKNFKQNFQDDLGNFHSLVKMEASCQIALNFQRECYYGDPNLLILNQNKCNQALTYLNKLYDLFKLYDVIEQSLILKTSSSQQVLIEIMHGNLCDNLFGIVPQLGSVSCTSFIDGSGTQVFAYIY